MTIRFPTMRAIALSAIASTWFVLVVSRLAASRRYVSHRIVDVDARAKSRAVDAWEDEGGAM